MPVEDLPAILTAMAKKAKEGDTAAASLLLDRMCPRLRPVSRVVEVELPEGSLATKANAAIDAMAAGEVPPDQINEFLGAFVKAAQLLETTELLQRLEALEAKFAKEKP